MRRLFRLAVVLTIAALALVGVGGPASSASGTLTKVTVEGDLGAKPTIKFSKPFSIKNTAHEVVTSGGGDELAKGQKIAFDYLLVDGRNGKELETSFGSTPGAMTLDASKTAPQLVKSLLGTTVGSRVLVAIAPKDGLAKNLKSSSVKKSDTLLFVIDVKSIALARAAGDPVAPAAGLPKVTLAANGKPTITVPSTAAPAQLVVQPLIKGAGPVVASGQTITVHYTGVIWANGKQFDSSWDRREPVDFSIGTGKVIAAWDEGLVGQTVGSQVLLLVPPDKGYGATGNSQAGISGTDTLVFVVDILNAY